MSVSYKSDMLCSDTENWCMVLESNNSRTCYDAEAVDVSYIR